jgi:hypothetical protein
VELKRKGAGPHDERRPGLAREVLLSIVVRMSTGQKQTSGAEGARPRGLYGQRPSKSHDEVRRREFQRIAAMSVRERMLEALALGDEVETILGGSKGGRDEGRGPG